LRYHGPKYSVAEVASGIVLGVKLTFTLLLGRTHAGHRDRRSQALPGRPPELNDRSTLASPARPEGGYRSIP
jgi:hypothetical protein